MSYFVAVFNYVLINNREADDTLEKIELKIYEHHRYACNFGTKYAILERTKRIVDDKKEPIVTKKPFSEISL